MNLVFIITITTIKHKCSRLCFLSIFDDSVIYLFFQSKIHYEMNKEIIRNWDVIYLFDCAGNVLHSSVSQFCLKIFSRQNIEFILAHSY